MSLVKCQRQNSTEWKLICNLFDPGKLYSMHQSINNVCSKKAIIRPNFDISNLDYPYALVGGAMAYMPTIYQPGSVDRSYMGRRGNDSDIEFIKSLPPVDKLIALSLYGSMLRGNARPHDNLQLISQKLLPGTDGGVLWPVVYDDVTKLSQYGAWMSEYLGNKIVYLNVPPHNAHWVDGADVQSVIGGDELFMSFTTTKREPMSISKLQQAIAYWCLDTSRSGESINGWKGLTFWFPRHKQMITVDFMKVLKPFEDGAWSMFWDAVYGLSLEWGSMSPQNKIAPDDRTPIF